MYVSVHESSGETLKMHKLIWVKAHAISDKISCTEYCVYWHGILEGTRAWRYNYRDGKGDTVPENFGIIPS